MVKKSKLVLMIDPETGKTVREKWKYIPSWEGLYQVSNYGRIRSMSRSFIRSNGRPGRVSGKVLKPFHKKGKKSDDGDYLFVHLSQNAKVRTVRVHRMVMLAFEGESELEVDHINRDRTDNRLANLRYVTHHENMQNVSIGQGEDSVHSFLTNEIVCRIRKDAADGNSMRWVANKHGISVSHVHSIVNYKSWRNVTCDDDQ